MKDNIFISKGASALLSFILSNKNEEGFFDKSNKYLAEAMQTSESSIKRQIKELQQAECVSIDTKVVLGATKNRRIIINDKAPFLLHFLRGSKMNPARVKNKPCKNEDFENMKTLVNTGVSDDFTRVKNEPREGQKMNLANTKKGFFLEYFNNKPPETLQKCQNPCILHLKTKISKNNFDNKSSIDTYSIYNTYSILNNIYINAGKGNFFEEILQKNQTLTNSTELVNTLLKADFLEKEKICAKKEKDDYSIINGLIEQHGLNDFLNIPKLITNSQWHQLLSIQHITEEKLIEALIEFEAYHKKQPQSKRKKDLYATIRNWINVDNTLLLSAIDIYNKFWISTGGLAIKFSALQKKNIVAILDKIEASTKKEFVSKQAKEEALLSLFTKFLNDVVPKDYHDKSIGKLFFNYDVIVADYKKRLSGQATTGVSYKTSSEKKKEALENQNILILNKEAEKSALAMYERLLKAGVPLQDMPEEIKQSSFFKSNYSSL
jgi:hypothetical protein